MRRHETGPGVSWREQCTKRRAGAIQQTGPHTAPVTKKKFPRWGSAQVRSESEAAAA